LVLIGLHKPELLIGNVKYQTSSIDDDLRKSYLASLEKNINLDELILDPLVSLDKVSKSLKIPAKHLSQLLNETYNLNFNDYINKYRIEKAVALIQSDDKKKMTILEVAYDVGFNSKTTFNTAFKKFTGKTPSEFRK